MTTQIYFASNKIGTITPQQLQRMLDRFNLGTLISSERTLHGVMGQTMFVSSSVGDYIVKGNPLFPGQFSEEKFFVDHLHQQTNINVPTPYLIDESEDIFGWSYAIMPHLPGRHIHPSDVQTTEEKEQITALMAQSLVELHKWRVQQYGEVDPQTFIVVPFEGSYRTWLYGTIMYWLNDAKKYSHITPQDMQWVEDVLHHSQHTFDNLHSPTFVMGDFKPENILIHHHDDKWEISGVFDFTTSYFGDCIADLPKMTAIYIMNGDATLARHFLSSYIRLSNPPSFNERFKVHMLHHCLLLWGCAKATNTVTWDEELTFAQWATPFTEFYTLE